VLVFFCIVVCFGCGSRETDRKSERKAVEQELQESQETEPYQEPDGAFGAKDFATEAKELSDRNTRDLEQAAQETENPDPIE
jgi:hypothetical protein